MKRILGLVAGVCVMGMAGTATAQAGTHAQPAAKVYDESVDARKQIADALATAKKDGKRVLVQWGGNWCPWCLRLNDLMHSNGEIAGALSAHYVRVHVDCGRPNGKNVDLADFYGAGAGIRQFGFPYLTVLDSDGKVVANQESRGLSGMEPGEDRPEDERLRSGHDAAKVLAFLLKNREQPRAKAAPVYDEGADAKTQIAEAIASAKQGGKRVLIQWGGNWCPWCIRLNQLMTTDAKIVEALRAGYVVVHVDAGRKEKNVDLAAQYKADVKKGGYPYLTVLDGEGTVVANQETGALEVKDAKGESVSVAAGHDPVKVLKFLEANRAAVGGGGK
ncbi:MAG TPA: thioredoxin family protein [Phycisphaerales bacterium]|nr:thioredoxin family protein [Phycisphaerales bacterium]